MNSGNEKQQEGNIEIFNNRLMAGEIFQSLKLPEWKNLRENLKQVFRIAAIGSMENAVAASCNLGPKTASKAAKASRGAADYIGRKARGLPGISPEIAVVLEEAIHRQGCNPRLHFHAAFQVHADQLHTLEASLLSTFASDYVEVACNKAILIKPITHPGRWASYCCKTFGRSGQVGGQASFATHSASRAGEELYNQVMHWLRELPTLEVLQTDLHGLIRPHIKSNPCPELLRLICQHAQHKNEAQRRRANQTRHFKRLAANNPDQFRFELITMFANTSTSINIPNLTLTELAEDTISQERNMGSPEHSGTLTERYRGLPGVGEWGTTDEDDGQLFDHHPDPES